VLLGGTFQRNVATPEPDERESERILHAHRTFFNGMEDPWS